MPSWEWLEVVALEEVVYAHAEQFRDETDVIAVIKPVQKMYAFTSGV